MAVWDAYSGSRCGTLRPPRSASTEDGSDDHSRPAARRAESDAHDGVCPAEWCLQASRDGDVVAIDFGGDSIGLFDTGRCRQIWSSHPGVDMVTLW